MEPEDLLTCWQEPVTYSYAEPDESSPRPPVLFVYVIPSTPRSSVCATLLYNLNYCWFDYVKNIWLGMQSWSPSLCAFFRPCYFLPLRCSYLPQHPILEHLRLCLSLSARYQVPHPYKRGKTIVFHILIFMFLDSKREGKILDRMVTGVNWV